MSDETEVKSAKQDKIDKKLNDAEGRIRRLEDKIKKMSDNWKKFAADYLGSVAKDGKLGYTRIWHAIGASCVLVVACYAATTIIDNKPGPEGAVLRFSDVTGVGTLEVLGGEGDNAVLILDSDEGDDNADTWTFTATASGNALTIKNHTTTMVSVDTSGNATFTGYVVGSGAGGTMSNATLYGTTTHAGTPIIHMTNNANAGVCLISAVSDAGGNAGDGMGINFSDGSGIEFQTDADSAGTLATKLAMGTTGILTMKGGATLDNTASAAELNITETTVKITGALTSTGLGTFAGLSTGTGEATVDSKYAVVGGDATTALMIQKGTFTNGQATVTFAVAFGGAPAVVCGFTDDTSSLANTNAAISATSIGTTTFVPKCAIAASAITNCNYIAVGTRP